MIAGRGGSSDHAAGGPARHTPVLLGAVLDALVPRENEIFLDGTFGAGGYTRALLATPGVRVFAIDRDPQAIADGQGLVDEARGRLTLAHGRFGDLEKLASQADFQQFDGITFDIGVSSMQLDEAGRGFSFREDGPLDMRMAQEGRSAAELVNEAEQDELADIIFQFGEERHSRRIARAIVADRVAAPFTTTRQLAGLLERIVPHKPGGIHPATRTFQALRIAVNDELGELTRGLEASERMLRPGGRLAVVSFHSLEDRIVKQFFAARSGKGRAQSRLLPGEIAPPASTFEVPGRQPVTADDNELQSNPRARSARLRHGVRTGAPAADANPVDAGRSRKSRR